MPTQDTQPLPENTLMIDRKILPINGERNLLEMARKAGIDIPTFCYHSELSIYGACRLCLVEVQGRGIMSSCSTPPEPGMRVLTNTEEIRNIRKITLELLLANHEMNCPACVKNTTCQLQHLARKLGVDHVRYKPVHAPQPIDRSSVSLVRDPNKCILCGDCVRACHEIQGVGAIDFAYRGSSSAVLPAFGKDLVQGECVNCGQCAAVCPTGALTPKSDVDDVWKALDAQDVHVVVQTAPAVRVGLGEYFGMEAGSVTTGQMVAALKALGFDRVFDTSFTADMTVLEESEEFLARFEKGDNLPQFTSCCPAWVKFAEQYYPECLPNLSSCKSPQQMFGSLARKIMPAELSVAPEKLKVVSVMPCTAKKFEAQLDKFKQDGRPDVDYVITTQELGRMIEQANIDFNALEPESFDMPLGFKTGAGVLFGVSGGVTEAVLRYAVEKLQNKPLERVDFHEVRGEAGVREATFEVNGITLKLAVVQGLANAKRIAESIKEGTCPYHLIEVMACPGGCVSGAGQPVSPNNTVRRARTKAIYHDDKMMQLHKAQENTALEKCYATHLGHVGGHKAHELLHTEYQNRRRMADEDLSLIQGKAAQKVAVRVCVGTSCFLNGSQQILKDLMAYAEANGLTDRLDLAATFCFERCGEAPNVRVGDVLLDRCTFEKVRDELTRQLEAHCTTTA